jgi:HAE1 family hydrophobic/amphiphilic exporter-1
MRRWLPAAAWDHPVTVAMGCLALLVLGVIAYTRIPLQMMPSGFEPSFLWVNVPYRDAAPKETDELVVRPIEGQLATIPGLASITSEAESGSAGFGLEFHQSVDMDQAYNDVVDRLERAIPELPADVDRYWIWRFDPNDEPIVWAGVSTPDTVSDPYFVMTRVVQPRLERIPGVASVDVWGVPQRRVQVDFDRERLSTHRLSSLQIQRALLADSFQMAGGRIEDRGTDRLVRSVSRMTDLEELRSFPVADGVTLSDVAEVRYALVGDRAINRVDGEDGAAPARWRTR